VQQRQRATRGNARSRRNVTTAGLVRAEPFAALRVGSYGFVSSQRRVSNPSCCETF
jgi:hypothetical protein